ncbi:MAG: hypothetical protein AAB288_10680 [Acidobacteriota bacterium]
MYHSGHKLINPYLLFEKARLAPNMHIADFGCGDTGHLIFPAAKIIGEDGVVYALGADPRVAAAQGWYLADPAAPALARVMGIDLEQRYARIDR